MPQTATLSEKQNCRSVSFFPLLLTGLNSKYKLRFNILSKGKKSQKFSISTFVFFMIKNNENQKIDINFQF